MRSLKNTFSQTLSVLMLCHLSVASVLGAETVSFLSMPHSGENSDIPTISVDFPPIKYENVVEVVTIDGVDYQIPEPWTGNRLFPTSLPIDALEQIPPDYAHKRSQIFLLAQALTPLLDMLQQAAADGIELQVESAYRSKSYQSRIFQRMLTQGRSFDDIIRYVAPPGYSQHMLGTAVDFYPSNWSFADTKQYQWLMEHAAEFGFEQTYSRYNRYRMPWESWHWNYIGLQAPDKIEAIAQQH